MKKYHITLFVLFFIFTYYCAANASEIVDSAIFPKKQCGIYSSIEDRQTNLTGQVSPEELKAALQNSFPQYDFRGYANSVKSKIMNRYPCHAKNIRDYLLTRWIKNNVTVKPLGKALSKAFIRYNVKGYVKNPTLKNTEIFSSPVYGLANFGVLKTSAKQKSRKLLVYFQGHDGNPFTKPYIAQVEEIAARTNHDVLYFSMVEKGFNVNSSRVSIPTLYSDLRFLSGSLNHDFLFNYYDRKEPYLTGNALMLSGPYWIIREVIKKYQYKDLAMTGISGGGWYTTMLSALMPEIDKSFSYAGTVPLALRMDRRRRNFGDYEQTSDPVLRKIGYWDLYVLATLNKSGLSSRVHTQSYNNRDPCCFNGDSAKILSMFYKIIGGIKGFTIRSIKSEFHEIDYNHLREMLGSSN